MNRFLRSFGVHLATAVLHAITDLPLVNIQSDVIHRFHGGASLVFLNQRPLSSAFLHQALLLDLYIQTNRDLTTGIKRVPVRKKRFIPSHTYREAHASSRCKPLDGLSADNVTL